MEEGQSTSIEHENVKPEINSEIESPNYAQNIDDLLKNISETGEFQTGTIITTAPIPGLFINGIGIISLPLIPFQIKQIIQQCEQAPYGKKDKTIVDKSIRNTFQLSPSQFQMTNPKWDDFLGHLKRQVKRGLGVIGDIELHLYKLLLYEPGGFFKRHRDTEKEEKMFATLILQLPTEHEGGQLVVKHNNKKKVFDFGGKDSAFCYYMAAFYADYEHEVLPVTMGYRLNLVYNVIYSGSGNVPSISTDITIPLGNYIDNWLNDTSASQPAKFIKILDHQYTMAGIGWDTLKGSDLEIVEAFKSISQEKKLLLFLGLVTVSQSGYATNEYDPYNTFAQLSMEISLKNLRDINNNQFSNKFIIEQNEILPRDFVTTLKNPDKEEVNEATGNEGTSMERWYNRMALVFLPISQLYNLQSIGKVVEKFQELVNRCGSTIDKNTIEYQKAAKFATQIISKIRITDNKYRISILHLLYRLDIFPLFVSILENDSPVDIVVQMAQRHGFSHFKQFFVLKIERSSTRDQFEIMIKCAGYKSEEEMKPVVLSGSQLEICNALVSIVVQYGGWYHTTAKYKSDESAFILKYIYIVNDIQLQDSFLKTLLQYRKLHHLVALSNKLYNWFGSLTPIVTILRDHLLDKVKEKRPKMISPVPDCWSLSVKKGCKCDDCCEYKEFMRDAKETEWRLQGIQGRRDHIQQRRDFGLIYTTERGSSPLTLVVSKDLCAIKAKLAKQANRIVQMDEFLRLHGQVLYCRLLEIKHVKNVNNVEEDRPVKRHKVDVIVVDE